MKRLFAVAFAFLFLLCGCARPLIPIHSVEGPTDFGKFSADAPGDTANPEALISSSLERYPQSLLRQLGPVQILLVSNLTGEENFARGHYAGFTQRVDDGWQIVLDVDAATAGTVHHEIAHILDSILTEAGALTEADWRSLCPSSFRWGDTNWADYPDFFCDEYAMTSLQEDRARVFEDAMQYGPGVYADSPALWLKLELFSRCLRAHFDSDDWPARTPWEEALE